jgi:hypothetical protein
MAFMFAPSSIDHFNIPATFWQLAFANAAGFAIAWILAQVLSGRAVNCAVGRDRDRPRGDGLHVVAERLHRADHLAARRLLRDPALLWATNAFRRLDREHQIPGIARISINARRRRDDLSHAAEPLVCESRPAADDGADGARHGLHVRRHAAGDVAALPV